MSKIDEVDYWVPEHVREYLRAMGFQLPLEPMESHIRSWHEWMQACGIKWLIRLDTKPSVEGESAASYAASCAAIPE